MNVGTIDSENRTVVNGCEACGGDHEVMIKNLNDKLKASTKKTHWFECPQHGQGGPVMIKVEDDED